MNFLINRLDNLVLENESFELVPDEFKKEINGMIVGTNGKFVFNNCDVMMLIKRSGIQNQIGINMYDALIRKPMMIFLLPTKPEEFYGTKEELDTRYGIKGINLNNLAQAFSLGCWFIKDSCVAATVIYWVNMFNGFNYQARREMDITLSDGTIAEITLTNSEMSEALKRMYEVCHYLLPWESKMGEIEKRISVGTTMWEIDKAISTEANSFARALTILQEARRTGILSSKIDKYCSILECLYAINKEHKKNISNITAAYIGGNSQEREEIRIAMREAYGVRSDSSHGDNLKYLKAHNQDDLKRLSFTIDDYVRRVFRKIFLNKELNYDKTTEKRAKTRLYFRTITEEFYSE